MSYSRCREIIKGALQEIGLDASKFGVHSLRSGSDSAAAAFGVSDRLFKRHGRWKSDLSKDSYIKETMSNKLLVSMNLGFKAFVKFTGSIFVCVGMRYVLLTLKKKKKKV